MAWRWTSPKTSSRPDLATLDLYCDRVASAVGRLSIKVFGMEEGPGFQLAHHLGRALQLTNILRDIDEDAGMLGVLYLPREYLSERRDSDRLTRKWCASDARVDAVCRHLAADGRTVIIRCRIGHPGEETQRPHPHALADGRGLFANPHRHRTGRLRAAPKPGFAEPERKLLALGSGPPGYEGGPCSFVIGAGAWPVCPPPRRWRRAARAVTLFGGRGPGGRALPFLFRSGIRRGDR